MNAYCTVQCYLKQAAAIICEVRNRHAVRKYNMVAITQGQQAEYPDH